MKYVILTFISVILLIIFVFISQSPSNQVNGDKNTAASSIAISEGKTSESMPNSPPKPPQQNNYIPVASSPASSNLGSFLKKELAIIRNLSAIGSDEDPRHALNKLDEYLRDNMHKQSPAFKQWYNKNYPILRFNLAFFHYNSGDMHKALEIAYDIESAIHSSTYDATLKKIPVNKLIALILFRQDKRLESKNYFLSHLDDNATDHDSLLALAQIEEEARNYPSAKGYYQKVIAQTEDETLQKKLQQKIESIVAELDYQESENVKETQNFKIFYQHNKHLEVANIVENFAEYFVADLVSAGYFLYPSKKIPMFIYDGEEFKNTTTGIPEWVEGLFDGKIKIPVRNTAEFIKNFDRRFEKVIGHEIVHALFHFNNVSLPTWFSEGIAQKLSMDIKPEFMLKFIKTIKSLNDGPFLSQTDLTGSFIGFDKPKAKLAYAQSIYLVHHLEERDYLFEIMQHLSIGNTTFDKALDRLHLSWDDFYYSVSTAWKEI